MTSTGWIRLASALMFLAVGLGAFGAHALKRRLDPALLGVFETGVRYQMIHALALFVVAWLLSETTGNAGVVNAAGWFFLAGILVFSGSLYFLSLTGVRSWGAVTPLGGLAFLGGWLCLLFSRS